MLFFDYDDYDSHILILSNNESLIIDEIELFTENQQIVNFLKKFNIPFDGTNFIVPNHLIDILDDFLLEYI